MFNSLEDIENYRRKMARERGYSNTPDAIRGLSDDVQIKPDRTEDRLEAVERKIDQLIELMAKAEGGEKPGGEDEPDKGGKVYGLSVPETQADVGDTPSDSAASLSAARRRKEKRDAHREHPDDIPTADTDEVRLEGGADGPDESKPEQEPSAAEMVKEIHEHTTTLVQELIKLNEVLGMAAGK